MRRQILSFTVVPALVLAVAVAPTLAEVSTVVVMTNLDSPRGLAFGPEGGLYVAEAGTGEILGPCTPSEGDASLGQNCYSGTGAITRLWRGVQERVATGLPSIVHDGVGVADGPQDIGFLGRSAYVTIGWAGAPDARDGLGELGRLFGTLLQVVPGGQWRVVADVSAYEAAYNPAGGPLDTNPYGLLVEPGRAFVADAGANAVLEIAANGTVSLVTALPSVPVPFPFNEADAVPTAVKRGPDGALYVSVLTGVPFLPGAAKIYRVVPGQLPQPYVEDLTSVTGFAFGPDGSLYVIEYATDIFLSGPGALIHIAPDGTRHVVTMELIHPTGVAVGPDGAVYVAHKGGLGDPPGEGEVVRIGF
jgi:hypothetical protein